MPPNQSLASGPQHICHLRIGVGSVLKYLIPQDGANLWDLAAEEGLAGEDVWLAFAHKPAAEVETMRDCIVRRISARPNGCELAFFIAVGNMPLEMELAALRDFLAPHVSGFAVVVFLDHPAEQMAETFIQQLQQAGAPPEFSRAAPNYQNILSPFDGVFGRDHVNFQLLPPSDVREERPSIFTMEAAALLHAYRLYCWYPQDEEPSLDRERELVRALGGIGSTPFAFAETVVKRALAWQGPKVTWLETRIGKPLPREGASNGVRSVEDLLTRSVGAAAQLLASGLSGLDPATAKPRTPREVAQMIHDFSLTLVPATEGGLPLGAFTVGIPASEREALLQADRLVMAQPHACYLHVGMAKTGTSSIQTTLRNAVVSTANEYLKVGPANHSSIIFSMFTKRPESFHVYRKRAWTQTRVQQTVGKVAPRVEAALRNNAHKKFIISGEVIPRLDKQEVEKMACFLRQFYDKIYVVAYIRSPKSYMESIFQQRLKGGTPVTRLEQTYPEYREKLEKFDQVFGVENVILRKFDPSLFPNKDVVIDFCQLTGIALPDYQSSKVNEALCLEAIALLFAYRRYGGLMGRGPTAIPQNRDLVSALRRMEGLKFSVTNAAVDAILNDEREDMEWIQRRAGFKFDVASPDAPTAVNSLEDLMELSNVGAQKLIAVFKDDFTPSIVSPATPREAAQVLLDYMRTLHPDLEITLLDSPKMPRRSWTREKRRRARQRSESRSVYQRVRRWVRKLWG